MSALLSELLAAQLALCAVVVLHECWRAELADRPGLAALAAVFTLLAVSAAAEL